MRATLFILGAAMLHAIALQGCDTAGSLREAEAATPAVADDLRGEPAPPASPAKPHVEQPIAAVATPLQFRDLFPGVRADLNARVVEFDAVVSPMLVDDPKAPLFFVETLVCTPDTKEHESLMVTSVKPSHLHAALLAVGFAPGKPGFFKFVNGRFEPVDASGERLALRVLHAAEVGRVTDVDPRTWLINAADREKPSPQRFGTDAVDAGRGWVFAGSSMREIADKSGAKNEMYDADGAGIVVGLCCFGSEVIAWSRTFSPEASISEPVWIADFSRTPPAGTKVRVRVARASDDGAGK